MLKNIALGTIVLGVSAIVAVAPARADWQFIRWGMTAQEFQNSSPIELKDGSYCPVNNSNGSQKYRVKYASDWDVGSMSFIACYLFKDEKLQIVNLHSKNANSEAVIKGLSQKYGYPFKDVTLASIGFIKYVWDRRDEKIEFNIISSKNAVYPYVVSYQSKADSDETSARDRL